MPCNPYPPPPQAVCLLGKLAKAMGRPIERSAKPLLGPALRNITDQKVTVRRGRARGGARGWAGGRGGAASRRAAPEMKRATRRSAGTAKWVFVRLPHLQAQTPLEVCLPSRPPCVLHVCACTCVRFLAGARGRVRDAGRVGVGGARRGGGARGHGGEAGAVPVPAWAAGCATGVRLPRGYRLIVHVMMVQGMMVPMGAAHACACRGWWRVGIRTSKKLPFAITSYMPSLPWSEGDGKGEQHDLSITTCHLWLPALHYPTPPCATTRLAPGPWPQVFLSPKTTADGKSESLR